MIMTPSFLQKPIRLMGERSDALNLARGRLVLLSSVFVLLFVLMAVRAVDLTLIQPPLEDVLALNNGIAQPIIKRGNIYDREGVLLATSLETPSLYADPKYIANPVETAQALQSIFPEMDLEALIQILTSTSRFVWIARNITPEDQKAILEIGEPGLNFQREAQRFYPQTDLMPHLLGYTNVDGQGLSGLERGVNEALARGENLTLSIDTRLQHALRRELTKAAADFSAKAGFGMVMDVRNGEILAGVSWPDYNPHAPTQTQKESQFNRLSLGVYELGSVFKIFSTALFLETHDAALSTSFDVREPIKIGRFMINDYHGQERILTIPEIFMHSSNIGTALMAREVGTEALRNFYEDLGLLVPLNFEVEEVSRPLVPEPWREVNTLTASYGHGLATTPLQAGAAIASIVNGGFLVQPTLIKDKPQSGPLLRVISEDTSEKMRQLLWLTVEHGTGSKAKVPGYAVGGKTGTAEKIGRGGYDKGRLISSFAGVFPIDNPRYLVFVGLDEPKGTKASYGYATGGWVAAPVVARVIKSMGILLNIPPHNLNVEKVRGDWQGEFENHIMKVNDHG